MRTTIIPNFIADNEQLEADDVQRRHLNNRFYLAREFKVLTAGYPLQANDYFASAVMTAGIDSAASAALTDKQIRDFKAAVIASVKQEIPSYRPPPPDVNAEYHSASRRAARNFLRHLTRGTRINSDDERYRDGLQLAEKSLNEIKDPDLLRALRIELTAIFQRAADWIQTVKHLDEDQALQFELFIEGLLAVYPFIEPEVRDRIVVPQKINGKWQAVSYTFNKLDISPRTGLLASLLEDQDRIYAYGLEPDEKQDPAASPHLLLMGTPQPTGPGEAIADLYNFYPRHSVGEVHNMQAVNHWFSKQTNPVIAVGQSMGATLAMILAGRHPEKIRRTYALCPTALTQATLQRLEPTWLSCPSAKRAEIIGIVQKGDPVFYLENGFLQGTKLFQITPGMPVVSHYKKHLPKGLQKAFEAHLHNFSGRSSVRVSSMDVNAVNRSRWREVGSDVKGALNWVLFPVKYVNLCASLIARKLERQSPIFKVLTKPLSWLGKVVNAAVKIATIPTAIVTTGLFSGLKTAVRSLFGVRSAYQQGNANDATVFKSFQGSTAALAQRGVANVQAQSEQQHPRAE